MQSDPTTPPKRIWADPPETFDGMDVWRSEPGGKGVEYILASEHAALIREAEVKMWEAAAKKVRCGAAIFTVNKEQGQAFNAVETLRAASDALLAEAAAIRAAKAAP